MVAWFTGLFGVSTTLGILRVRSVHDKGFRMAEIWWLDSHVT